MKRQRRSRHTYRLLAIAVAAFLLVVFAPVISAQDAATAEAINGLQVSIDTTWVLLTGFLVFFM